jgi:glycosyltransferase involved in cell wall biosynthesis
LKIKNVIFLEPYDGGSHQAFRKGLEARSRHRITSHTLPGRFWKWRMRGAAVWYADLINAELAAKGPEAAPDLVFATGFLNLADLRGLLDPPADRTPILLYMHENQLTYPLSPEEEFDFHFGFTNIVSTLAADRVVFNSAYHRDLFLDALPSYLNRMPEAVPREVGPRLASRSDVLPVGLDRAPLPEDHFPLYRGGRCDPESGPAWPRGERHLLLWNHRWEFDKRPDLFAQAVVRLLDRGLDFDVALLGESRGQEKAFTGLRDRLGDRCVAFGHQESRADYDRWLARADIVVSCAEQEYFGISVAEAIHAGCYPVLPRGQVYPSLYGSRCKGRHLYDDEEGLVTLLADLIGGDECGHVCSLDRDVDPCCWDRLAPRFDDLIAEVADAGRITSTRPTREGGSS